MIVYNPMMRHGDGCVLRLGHDGDCATAEEIERVRGLLEQEQRGARPRKTARK